MGKTEGVNRDFHCYGHSCGLKIIQRAIAYFGIDVMFSQSVSCWGLGWGWRSLYSCSWEEGS